MDITMSFAEIFEQTFQHIEQAKDVGAAIEIFRNAYHVDHVTYHMAQTVASAIDAPFVRTTYPAEWVSRYLLRGYVNVDPIVIEGVVRQLPFLWSDVHPTPQAYEMLLDALSFGLGSSGYSIPITDKVGRRALLSLNSKLPEEDWLSMVLDHREYWLELSYLLHSKALVELYGKKDPAPPLAPRERECLYWAALGKDHKDISIILGIADHTVRGYLKSARFKLSCANIPQAVAKAIKLRLINP